MTKRKSKYISIWKKTYEQLKKIASNRQEPMTVVVQRMVEMFDK